MLAPVSSDGPGVLCWPRCAVLAPECCAGPGVLCWPRCAVLAPVCCAGPVVLCWPRCAVLAPVCSLGPGLQCWPRLQVENLPAPYGSCVSDKTLKYFDFYSPSACQVDCLTSFVVERCRCRDTYMPQKTGGTW